MRNILNTATSTTPRKVIASLAVAAAAAGIAGLGTFGSFTSTTSASTAVDSGTVAIALGANGASNRLSVPATGLVPGDTVARAATLTNNGNQDLSTLTLTSAATTSSLLDTNATMGLQIKIDTCSVPWTEAGTAPAYTYTCTGTTGTALASRPVITTNTPLNLTKALTAGLTDHLRVTLTLPDTADNTLQAKSSVIGLSFTGTQRTATNK